MYNNYGLSGQYLEDEFLCFGKKCKDRKKERHETKMAKRKAKVESQKAENERLRAETATMTHLATTSVAPSAQNAAPTPVAVPSASPKVGTGMVALFLGVLAVGGYIFYKKKNPSTPLTPAM